jgi:hypothetical protein
MAEAERERGLLEGLNAWRDRCAEREDTFARAAASRGAEAHRRNTSATWALVAVMTLYAGHKLLPSIEDLINANTNLLNAQAEAALIQARAQAYDAASNEIFDLTNQREVDKVFDNIIR